MPRRIRPLGHCSRCTRALWAAADDAERWDREYGEDRLLMCPGCQPSEKIAEPEEIAEPEGKVSWPVADRAELRVGQVSKLLRQLHRDVSDSLRGQVVPGGSMFLGDGMLVCALCNEPLAGGQPVGNHNPSPFGARYQCTGDDGCGGVYLSVAAVDRELQKLTRQRLWDPEFQTRWQAARMAELDARVVELRDVLLWCGDRRRLRQLARRQSLERWLGFPHPKDLRDTLWELACHLSDLMIERTQLAGTPTRKTDSGPLNRLKRMRREYTTVALAARPGYLIWKGRRQELLRELGGRKQLDALLDRLYSEFMEHLTTMDWYPVGPPRLPSDDKALWQDWSQSPVTQVQQRRALLDLARGTDELLVDPDAQAGSRVRRVTRT